MDEPTIAQINLDEMARKALVEASGAMYGEAPDEGPRYVFTMKALEAFARQAVLAERAAERERCAQLCEPVTVQIPDRGERPEGFVGNWISGGTIVLQRTAEEIAAAIRNQEG